MSFRVKVAQVIPIYWMNAAEVAFFVLKLWEYWLLQNVGSDAKTLYEKGCSLIRTMKLQVALMIYFANNQDKNSY